MNDLVKKRFVAPHLYQPVDDSLCLWLNGRGSRRQGSVLEDLSKKKQPCVNHGATWGNTPLGHSVLNFDGDSDYINCGNDPSLNITDAITIEAWVNLATTPNAYNKFVTKASDYENARYELGRYRSGVGGNLYWFIRKLDGNIFRISATAPVADRWYHFVGTYEQGVGIKLYIDGILESSNSDYIGAIDSTAYSLRIGGFFAGPGPEWYFNGTIDEVRIYNRALSAEEIMMRYWNTRFLYGF